MVLYLFGMGLISPLGTAIALHPFGQQAGLASALPVAPAHALAIVLFAASALALLLFLPAGGETRGGR